MTAQPNLLTAPLDTSDEATEPTRRAAQKARTVESILEAAGNAFAARGYEGTTLRQIAEAVGVGQPLLVYHFGSKEGIWRAAVDRLFGRVVAATEAAVSSSDPEAGDTQLRGLLRSFIGVVAAEPAWLQILLREAAEPGPRLDWLVEHHSGATYRAGVTFLEEARRRGLLPDLPTDHLLYVLFGALAFVVAIAPEVRRVTGRDVRTAAFLDRHVDTLLALIATGRSTAPL